MKRSDHDLRLARWVSAAALLGACAVRASTLDWAVETGSSSFDHGFGVAVGGGGVHACGAFTGTADFDPDGPVFSLTSRNGTAPDVYVWSLTTTGAFRWAQRAGGDFADVPGGIAVTGSGDVVVAGSFSGNADFGPAVLTSAGGANGFVSRLDGATGAFRWTRQVGRGGNVEVHAVALDPMDGIYLAGRFEGTADFDTSGSSPWPLTAVQTDAFVARLDAAGSLMWARAITGPGTEDAWGVAIDRDGRVLTTGQYEAGADFDPDPTQVVTIGSRGAEDAYVSVLDRNGRFIGASGVGGAGTDVGRAIGVDAAGAAYFTGSFSGQADFDPGPGSVLLSSLGPADAFVAKLRDGRLEWAHRLGGPDADLGFGLAVDASGVVRTTGRFLGTADFDPGPAAFDLSAPGLGADVYVSALDAAGKFVSADRLGGDGDDQGYGLAVDAAGSTHATGAFTGPADFDPTPAGSYVLDGHAGPFPYDAFLCKLSPGACHVHATGCVGECVCKPGSPPVRCPVDGWSTTFTALGGGYRVQALPAESLPLCFSHEAAVTIRVSGPGGTTVTNGVISPPAASIAFTTAPDDTVSVDVRLVPVRRVPCPGLGDQPFRISTDDCP